MSHHVTFTRKPLAAAITATFLLMMSGQASAALTAAVCGANNIANACAPGENLVSGGILTIRGYALDMETRDRPVPGGHVIVRNEDTGLSYKIPIQRTEVRPDIVSSHLSSGSIQASGSLTADQYDLLNAGFIAQAFMASLPPGRYSVVEARVTMKKNGITTIPLTAENRGMFQIGQSDGGSFRLVKPDGTAVPLSIKQASGGKLALTGYPALRSGDYTIEASLPSPSGNSTAQAAIKYRRPVMEVPVSVPLVEGFPGQMPNITPVNPLTKRALDAESLSVVVDDSGQSSVINGESADVGKRFLLQKPSSTQSGVFRTKVSDTAETAGEQTVKLFVEQPDAPDIHLKVKRWSPHDMVEAAPSKPTAAMRVEDIDVDAKLKSKSEDICQTLMQVRPEYRLSQSNSITCALAWDALPDGMTYNPYRSNALRGSLPSTGPNTFTYRPGVVYTDPETKRTAFYPSRAGTKTMLVNGVQPEPPALTLVPDKNLKPIYDAAGSRFPGKGFAQVDPANPRFAGNVNVKANYRNILSRVTYSDGTEKTYYASFPNANLPIAIQADAPWGSYPVRVESAYERAPDIKTDQVFDFLGVPMPPTVAFDREVVSNDQSDTVLTGYIGTVRGQTVTFDPSTMGQWQVSVEMEDGTVLGQAVPVDAQGKFSINLGRLSTGTRKIYAVGQMVSSTQGVIDHRVRSIAKFLVTEKGQGIEGTLIVRSQSGPAPFSQNIQVSLADSTLLRNLDQPKWEVQQPDGSWQRVAGRDNTEYAGMSYTPTIENATSVNYRAVLRNKFSGVETTTPPITLQAYNLPSFRVITPQVVVAGKQVTLAIEEDTGFSANYSWKFISRGKVENQSPAEGKTFSFTPADQQSYVVEVTGSQAGAPSDDPRSKVSKVVAFKAVNPLVARAQITGPSMVEVGKTYNFKAKINDVVPGVLEKSYQVKGYWSLPDGGRVDGNEINYTVRPGDNGLNFVTYVDGYPDETSVAVHTWRSWEYQWPSNWRIRMTPLFTDVPAQIRYSVEAVDFDLRQLMGENITYTWSLPNGVTRNGDPSSGTLEISQHGTYQVAVQVSDTRGNVVNVTSDQFSILPAAQVEVDARLVSKYGENYYAPGTYYVGAKIARLPRGDSFLRNELILNGQKVGEFSGSGSYVSFAQPGEYNLVVRTVTKMGNYGEQTLAINVQDAPTPTCAVSSQITSSGAYMTPNCTLEVGYVKSYKWQYMLDGQPQQSTSKYFAAMKSWIDAGRVSGITLTVESDLGKTTTIPVNLP